MELSETRVSRVPYTKVRLHLPLTEQQDQSWNCGPCCLRTAGLFFGVDRPLGVWENDTGALWDKKFAGASWDGMLRAAKVNGLRAKLMQANNNNEGLKALRLYTTQQTVAIICVRAYGGTHYVIPVGWETGTVNSHNGRILFYDPMLPPGELGIMSIATIQLTKRWHDDLTILLIGADRPLLVARNIPI